MPSRLGAFCERAIEASWLVALVTIPLLFNVRSANSFELDKVVLLRSLAWVAVSLVAVVWIERRRSGSSERMFPNDAMGRWAQVALALFAVHALSTLSSVSQRASVMGSTVRFQGLYTLVAYLVFYASLLAFLRRREQVERIFDAALLASLPVSLYGIIQRFGTDPVTWVTVPSERVASSLGNPIFVGAYLILVVPIAIYRHVEAGRRIASGEPRAMRLVLVVGGVACLVLQIAAWSRGPLSGTLGAIVIMGVWATEAGFLGKTRAPFLRLGAYNVLLSVQLSCLLLSQSRGPWLGLAAGLGFLALVWALARQRWMWARLTIFAGVSVCVLLTLLNAPTSFLSRAGDVPYLNRLTQLSRTSGGVRLIVWEATTDLLRSNPARAIVGYGPETFRLVIAPHVPPELGHFETRGILPDRAHNETFDWLATTGVLGLFVQLLWMTALLSCGLTSVGLTRARRHRFALGAACLGGAVTTALLTRVADGSWRLLGPGLSLGLVAGAFGYLASYALWGTRVSTEGPARPRPWSDTQQMSAVLLAAIVAYHVETQFAFGITATRFYFFVFAACLVALTAFSPSAAAAAPALSPSRRQALASGLVALALAAVVHDFWPGPSVATELLGLPWLATFTWLLGGIVVVATGERPTLRIFIAVTVASVLAFAAARYAWTAWRSEPAGGSELFTAFVLFEVLLLVTLLSENAAPAGRLRFSWAAPAYVVLGFGVLALVFGPTLDVVRADVSIKQARVAAGAGRWDEAIVWARLAVERQPANDAYRTELGRLFEQQAAAASSPRERGRARRLAERSYRAALALTPLDPDHSAGLSRFFVRRAIAAGDVETKQEHFARALALSDDALERFPGNVRLWNERASIYLTMGRNVDAHEALDRSLELDNRFAETHLQKGDLMLAEGGYEEAALSYEAALAASGPSRKRRVLTRLAAFYASHGRLDEAIEANESILELNPDDPMGHSNLATLYFAKSDWERSLVHVRRALEHSRQENRPPLERLEAELEERLR